MRLPIIPWDPLLCFHWDPLLSVQGIRHPIIPWDPLPYVSHGIRYPMFPWDLLPYVLLGSVTSCLLRSVTQYFIAIRCS